MAEITIRRVVEITDEEKNKLVDLCFRAYENHPSMLPMLGGRVELRTLLFRAMVGAGALDGELYVLENVLTKDIYSMALWFSPGKAMFSTEQQRSLGFNDLMKELDVDTKLWWKDVYGVYLSEEVPKALGGKTSLESWWLNVLATDPDHQRRGYGSSITLATLRNIPSPNLAAFCATTKETADFYNHIGFETKSFHELPSKFGILPVWCVARNID